MAKTTDKRRPIEVEALLSRYERTAAFLPVYIYAARIENGQIIPEFYSTVVERITGYSYQEFLKDPWFWLSMVYWEDRPLLDDALKEGFQHEYEVSEYRIVRKDGTVRWVRDQLRVSFNEQDQPTGYYGTVEDITERKQIEAELAASEQRYRDLVESADDIICKQDACGVITSINAAGERFFGYPRNKLIGKRWSDLLAQFSAQSQPEETLLHEELTAKGNACATIKLRSATGKETVFDFKFTLIKQAVKTLGLCGVGRDITLIEQQRSQLAQAYLQLKNAQQQIVRTERMVAMAQLAGTLMHEINNPLAVILGYAQMLSQANDLPASMVTQLQKIEEMTLRISETLEQLDSLEDNIVDFGGAKLIDLHHQQHQTKSSAK
ncbi:MAG: PAS domain S-box protein [Acidobacteriota bacterium]